MVRLVGREKAIFIGIVAVIIYILAKRKSKSGVEIFFSRKQTRTIQLVEMFLRKQEPFVPCWYLLSGHAQSLMVILMSIIERKKRIPYRREIIRVEPKKNSKFLPGWIALDYLDHDQQESKGLVFIVPGLTGSSQSHYAQIFAQQFAKEQFDVAVLNYRVSAGVEALNGQAYCGAYTEDIRECVKHVLESRAVKSNVFIIGFSLGANLVAKYIAEEGEKAVNVFSGAACLGSPHDLLISSKLMHRSWLRKSLYSIPLAKKACSMILGKQKKFFADGNEFGVDLKDMKNIHTLRDLDSAITAKVFGYRSCDDYYRDSSTANRMHEICVPTLLISALDDPVCDRDAIPYEEVKQSDHVILMVTPSGGHGMEWFTGIGYPKSWSVKVVQNFVNGILSLKKDQPIDSNSESFVQSE
jgi:predicted alpha/beta-fold hydrolase